MRVEKGKTYSLTARGREGERLTAIVVTRGGALLANGRGQTYRIYENNVLYAMNGPTAVAAKVGKVDRVLQESEQ